MTPGIQASPAHGPYSQRKGSGKIENSVNPHISFGNRNRTRVPVRIETPSSNPKRFRYMSENYGDKATNMNDTMEILMKRLTDEIVASEEDEKMTDTDTDPNQTNIELADINVPAQNLVYMGGRIVSEHEGRLNTNSLFLEGDLSTSSGRKVKLDVSNVENYSIFPNQVVVLKARNPSGREIVAEKIYSNATLQKSTHGIMKRDMPIMSIVACGPFTLKNSLAYHNSPLKDLVNAIRQNQPDIVILCGPFISEDNDLVKNNQCDKPFEDYFHRILQSFEQDAVQVCKGLRIVLVPSTKDIHHDKVFPQLPYAVSESSTTLCLPNPAQFSINGVTFAVGTADFVQHSVRQEIHRQPKDAPRTNRLASLARHCIHQQSMYPLYPAHESICMDYMQEELLSMKCTPDVLILPSLLRHYAEINQKDGVLYMNPGLLTKGASGGTYGIIVNDIKNLEAKKLMNHTRADVVRI